MIQLDIEQISFEYLLNSRNERVVSFGAGDSLNWSQLRRRVFLLRNKLHESAHENWILASNSRRTFIVGLLALVAAKKEIFLAANNLAGTLANTVHGAQAFLTDLDLDTDLPVLRLTDLEGEPEYDDIHLDPGLQFIQICTSGSSGEPKQIRKSLATLESELRCLERQWGGLVDNKVVISTVSHQHIYGLLFRLLWPLMTNRVFVEENIEYPEQIATLAKKYGNLILISSPAYLKRMASVLNKDVMQQRVKAIYSSGGPLDHATAIFYTNQFTTTPIEVLGSTETGGIAHRQQTDQEELLWQKFDEVEIRQEPKNGALVVKSPFCFSQDWYEMGDVVELKSSAMFKLLGRRDRIVKLEEKRISLDQMETILGQSECIEQAKITVLQGHRTILGGVCILSATGTKLFAQLSRREFSEQLREYMSYYFDRVTLPRKWRYVPDFPYNTQGKLTQADLARLFDKEQYD